MRGVHRLLSHNALTPARGFGRNRLVYVSYLALTRWFILYLYGRICDILDTQTLQ